LFTSLVRTAKCFYGDHGLGTEQSEIIFRKSSHAISLLHGYMVTWPTRYYIITIFGFPQYPVAHKNAPNFAMMHVVLLYNRIHSERAKL